MLTTFGKTLLGLEGVKIFLASRFETASFAFAFDALKKIKKEPVYLGKHSYNTVQYTGTAPAKWLLL